MKCLRCGCPTIYGKGGRLYCDRCGIYIEDFEQSLRQLHFDIQGYTHNLPTTERIMDKVMKVIRGE